MLYFKNRPFFPKTADDVQQIGRVLEFRNEVQAQGALIAEFAEPNDFGDLARQHLSMEVHEILRTSASTARDVAARGHDGLHDSVGYESPAAVSVRPTLAIVYRPDGWYVQNKGRGAALDVLIAQKHVKGPERGKWFNPVRIPTLGPGDDFHLKWFGHENETGLGAAYRDEDGRPFTAITGNDLTKVVREWAFPPFTEKEIRRHWQVEGFR